VAIKCRIWYDTATGAYVLSSSYTQKFIDALKLLIPAGSRDREYDPSTKFWYFAEPYGEMVRQLAEKFFGVGAVSFTSKTVAQQAASQQAKLASARSPIDACVVEFFRLLSYEAAKKAYRQASIELHPDRPNGDAVKMSRLNELWSRIEKEVYNR